MVQLTNQFATDFDLQPSAFVDRILDRHAVCEMVGLGQTAVYEEIKAGRFPRSRKISKRRRGWLLSEVQEFLRTREVA